MSLSCAKLPSTYSHVLTVPCRFLKPQKSRRVDRLHRWRSLHMMSLCRKHKYVKVWFIPLILFSKFKLRSRSLAGCWFRPTGPKSASSKARDNIVWLPSGYTIASKWGLGEFLAARYANPPATASSMAMFCTLLKKNRSQWVAEAV